MSAQHTAGPWAWDSDDDDRMVRGPGGNAIAKVWSFEDFPCADEDDEAQFEIEQEANARLIAAAPELLEQRDQLLSALRDMERELGRFLNAHYTDQVQQHTDNDTISAVRAARAAIARAEKGQP